MSILNIYKYPNPVLRQVSRPITLSTAAATVYDPAIRQLIDDMVETMYEFPGAVGLSAIQVGHPWRLFVMDMEAKTTRGACRIVINPVIVQQSRNKLVREGCLSFPDYLANVKRATRLTVSYYDETGTPQTTTLEGLEAVAIQHELDHLDGILFIDRIQSLKTDLIRRNSSTIEKTE